MGLHPRKTWETWAIMETSPLQLPFFKVTYLTAAAVGKGWVVMMLIMELHETRDLVLFPALLPHLKQCLTQSWY